jgi:hypothetical protein
LRRTLRDEGAAVRTIALIGLAALVMMLGGVSPASAAAGPATRPSADARPAAGTTNPSISGSRVSCGSAKSCLAVSENADNAGDTTPAADFWNGTTWRPVTVPLPKGAGGGVNGVSCKQASCLVIGYYSSDSGFYPLALRWNGKLLATVAAPPMPAGAGDATLGDVSCAAVASCVMIGSATTSAGAWTVIDTWNGATWTMRAFALPAGLAEILYNGISCVSAEHCVAGGMSYSKSVAIEPVLALWNGRGVTLVTAPTPKKGPGLAVISDVACVSTTSCVASGIGGLSLSLSASSSYGFTDVLTGTTWKAAAIEWPKGSASSGLLAVSCESARNCVTVGGDDITNVNAANSGDAAAVSYNGKAWAVQKGVPGPAKGSASGFGGVACVTATMCVAAGLTGKTSGSAAVPLNGVWNGKSWRLFQLP